MSTWTNTHGIDEAIAQAIMNDPYERVGDISVTSLIKPPQMVFLERLHSTEIVEDVSDGLWRLLGTAVHSILERANLDNVLQEERLLADVGGWIISGKPDLWCEPGDLDDYKCTSVFAFLLGDKPEWEQQLNLYAALYRRAGFPVDRLQIKAILRDWQRSRSVEAGYPAIPFMVVDIPVWSPNQAEAFLSARVALHQEAHDHAIFPPCTPEERWARPDTWAVKKVGNKRAMQGGVCETLAEAEALIAAVGATGVKTEMEYRPGRNIRCESYCQAAPWCKQWQQLKPTILNPEALEQAVKELWG